MKIFTRKFLVLAALVALVSVFQAPWAFADSGKSSEHKESAAHVRLGIDAQALRGEGKSHFLQFVSGFRHRGEDDGDKEENKNKARGKSIDCLKMPPGHFHAPGWLKKIGGLGLVFSNCEGTTTPPVLDVTAPVISGVNANTIGTSSARIQWLTNESATSKVYFGTSSPLSLSVAASFSGNTGTSHTVNLSGLATNTVYYFVVESKDSANNTATSSQLSFTTSTVPDTTPPTISGVTISGIASTSAMVSWLTNESATGKIYFGTSTPLQLSSATALATTSLATAHNFSLTGLLASTTYRFILESKDSLGNTATTSEHSFVTGN